MRRPSCLGLLLLSALGAGGCALPAAVAYKFLGPPATEARYQPAKEPMLVLVENTRSPGGTDPEADELAATVCEELVANQVAPTIDPQKLQELRDLHPEMFRRMSIAQIGREVGARQILYIDLKQLELETPRGSDMVKLKMAVAVKMVDATDARTLWPGHDGGEPFEHQSQLMRITPEMSAAMLKRQALRESGIQIAKMFYKHQADTMSEENKDVRLR